MTDTTGTGFDTSSDEGVDSSGPEVSQQDSAPDTSQGNPNPAWDSLRSQLDPTTFQLVQPHLQQFDKQAQGRITQLNSQLKAYSSLGSPEQLKNYSVIAQRLDTQPEVIYQALGQFLKDNGRLPNNDAELADAVDDQEQEGQQQQDDPRIQQMEQGLQSIQQFFQQQQAAQEAAAADAALEQEVGQLRQAHPEFEDADVQEIIQRAAFLAMTNQQEVSLEDVASEYVEKTLNRIRNAPRAGDSAPRLLPTAGGVPSSPQAPSLGDMPKTAVQDLVANYLTQGNG